MENDVLVPLFGLSVVSTLFGLLYLITFKLGKKATAIVFYLGMLVNLYLFTNALYAFNIPATVWDQLLDNFQWWYPLVIVGPGAILYFIYAVLSAGHQLKNQPPKPPQS